MKQELNFCAEMYIGQGKGLDILNATVELAKDSMNRNVIGYSAKNEGLKKQVIDYACERANVDTSLFNAEKKEDFQKLINGNALFSEAIFSVVTKAVEAINTKVELNQAYAFIEFLNMADGDSINQRQEANGIVEFKSTGYSNNSQMVKYRFDDNKTLLPERKEAGIAMDIYQMSAYGFDWGRFVADIALGQRHSIQKEAIESMMATSNLLSSSFALASFAKDDYIELCETLSAFNGRPTIAYATKSAWGKVADNGIDTKYLYGTMGDEIVKTGMIKDIFDTQSVVLDQSTSRDGQYTLQIPSNKIILAPAGAKPVKCLMEGSNRIEADMNGNNSIGVRTYKVITSWKTDVLYTGATGIVTI